MSSVTARVVKADELARLPVLVDLEEDPLARLYETSLSDKQRDLVAWFFGGTRPSKQTFTRTVRAMLRWMAILHCGYQTQATGYVTLHRPYSARDADAFVVACSSLEEVRPWLRLAEAHRSRLFAGRPMEEPTTFSVLVSKAAAVARTNLHDAARHLCDQLGRKDRVSSLPSSSPPFINLNGRIKPLLVGDITRALTCTSTRFTPRQLDTRWSGVCAWTGEPIASPREAILHVLRYPVGIWALLITKASSAVEPPPPAEPMDVDDEPIVKTEPVIDLIEEDEEVRPPASKKVKAKEEEADDDGWISTASFAKKPIAREPAPRAQPATITTTVVEYYVTLSKSLVTRLSAVLFGISFAKLALHTRAEPLPHELVSWWHSPDHCDFDALLASICSHTGGSWLSIARFFVPLVFKRPPVEPGQHYVPPDFVGLCCNEPALGIQIDRLMRKIALLSISKEAADQQTYNELYAEETNAWINDAYTATVSKNRAATDLTRTIGDKILKDRTLACFLRLAFDSWPASGRFAL